MKPGQSHGQGHSRAPGREPERVRCLRGCLRPEVAREMHFQVPVIYGKVAPRNIGEGAEEAGGKGGGPAGRAWLHASAAPTKNSWAHAQPRARALGSHAPCHWLWPPLPTEVALDPPKVLQAPGEARAHGSPHPSAVSGICQDPPPPPQALGKASSSLRRHRRPKCRGSRSAFCPSGAHSTYIPACLPFAPSPYRRRQVF